MTILQALNAHYERLHTNDSNTPAFGYSREKISYAIVLSEKGEAIDVQPLLDTSGKKPRPRLLSVPQLAKRTVGIKSNFLWDKTSYVLGVPTLPEKPANEATGLYEDRVEKIRERCAREHSSFKELHVSLLADTDDVGLTALLRFVETWIPTHFGRLHCHKDLFGANLVFNLDGDQDFLHVRTKARHLVAMHVANMAGEEGFCLVTGRNAPISRLHPAIKCVRGAHSSGGSIVSFNLDAFKSFGKRQGANAPVCEQAAFAYTTALNTLLAHDSRQRVQVGDTTVVFWAEATGDEAAAAAAENLLLMLIAESDSATDEEEAAKVADVLKQVAAGRPLAHTGLGVQEETRVHVLGLAPNAARLSIRFWEVGSIGMIGRRIVEHWRDVRIEPAPWQTPPAARRLLYETAVQGKAENIPPTLGGPLMRAILTGVPYPRSLFAAIITRMRADKTINGVRAAICKAYLARDHRLNPAKEDVPMSLNPDETNPAYRLGRLFAVYEGIQKAAQGSVNATIKDRYYGAASATPASVFPMLMRSSAHHLSLLRKDGKGGWYEREIDAILSGVGTVFPRSLHLEDQGRFALGYHHQRVTKRSAPQRAGEQPADTEDKEV